MAIRMKENENVTRFAMRFWTIYSQIEDANDEMVVMCFKEALLPGNELRREFIRYPVATMKALMTRVTQFIEQEEDNTRARENFRLKREGTRSRDGPPLVDKKLFPRKEKSHDKVPSGSVMTSAPTSGGKKKNKPSAYSYKAINTVFKEPIYRLLGKIRTQLFFKWPPPMKGDPSTRINYVPSTSRTGTKRRTACLSSLTSKGSSRKAT